MPAHWTFRFIAVGALLFGLFAAQVAPHATVSITHLRRAHVVARQA